MEYEVKIDPESLQQRIVSVREQLANEFVVDVDLVRTANDQSEYVFLLLSSHYGPLQFNLIMFIVNTSP